MRGDVSGNWIISISSVTNFFFALRSLFTLINSAYPEEMPHDGI